MGPKELFDLVKEAFKDWQEDKAARLGAALAYYTIFAIGPLLIIVITIAGRVFGEAAVQGQIVETIEGVMGREGAEVIQGMIENAGRPDVNNIAGVVGVVFLFLAAAGLFGQLQDALNTIWEVQPKPGAGLLVTIKIRLLSFGMVLAVGFLMLVSLLVNALLAALSDILVDYLPGGPLIWQGVSFVVSVLVITLLFALIFKILPDAKVAWKDVWIGAIVTALLFMLGQIAISIYLGFSDVGSAYGAAGSLVVVLVWIYYSSQILFLGAEIAQVYARKYGSGIVPKEYAMLLTQEARAQQGMQPSKDDTKERGPSRIERQVASPWFK